MRYNWKNILIKIVILLISEILLNFLGLDTLADYGEFVFSNKATIQS